MSETPDGTISVDDPLELMVDDGQADEAPETEELSEEEQDAEQAEADADPEEGETDEDEELEADPEDEDTEAETVDIFNPETGEWETVDRDEAKASYMRHADYTRKTMEVAENRKALEAEKAQTTELKSQLMDALAQWAVPTEQQPNWAELSQVMDPRDYIQAQAQWTQQQQASEQAKALWRQLQAHNEAQEKASRESALVEAFPEWRDPATGRQAMTEIASIAREYEVTGEELMGVLDPRVARIIQDAGKYRAMQASQAETKKKVAKTSRALPPGGKVTAKQQAAKRTKETAARLRKGEEGAFGDWLLSG